MLLNVLVFGVIIYLLVNFLTHPVDLFTLLAHLLSIFRDPNSLVVQSLFLLVNGQLFCLLIRCHLSLLSSADLIKTCLTLLYDLLKLGEFVALAALQRCRVLIELLPLVLLCHDELLDRLDLEVQFLSLVIVFSFGCVGFFLGCFCLLRLQDSDICGKGILLGREILLGYGQLYHLQLVPEDTILDDLTRL